MQQIFALGFDFLPSSILATTNRRENAMMAKFTPTKSLNQA